MAWTNLSKYKLVSKDTPIHKARILIFELILVLSIMALGISARVLSAYAQAPGVCIAAAVLTIVIIPAT
jgi:hypothetical protein